MNQLLLHNHKPIALDKDGYLRRLEDWSPEVADKLAAAQALELSEAHWEVIDALRAFYQSTGLSPAMRPLVKLIATELGKDKGRSIYLMKLFPGNPALLASKIAGLPRPTNCF